MASTHTVNVFLLQYDSSHTAEAGTNSSTIYITNHNCNVGDFIVDTTIRNDYYKQRRGCRRIYNIVNDDVMQTRITNGSMTSGDTIRLYKFNNINDYVLLNSINISLNSEMDNTANLTLAIPTSASGMSFNVYLGQYLRIEMDSSIVFIGIIDSISKKRRGEESTSLMVSIKLVSLKNRANTIPYWADYDQGTATEDIATDCAITMGEDGFWYNTIDSGVVLKEAIRSGAVTIRELMDDIASKNGYQWYVDNDFDFNFVNEVSIVDSTYDIDENGSFNDFRDVKIDIALSDYANACRFWGGDVDRGVYLIVSNHNNDEENAIQDLIAGSGEYYKCINDGSIKDYQVLTAAAGTTSTTLKITGHPFVNEWSTFVNITRSAGYEFVKSIVDENTLTTTSVTDQAENDEILYFTTAHKIANNILKRQSTMPTILKFHTFESSFRPQQKLYVNLPSYDIEGYFCIETVDITDASRGYYNFSITAVMRDNSNFSTQKRKNSIADYFKEF